MQLGILILMILSFAFTGSCKGQDDTKIVSRFAALNDTGYLEVVKDETGLLCVYTVVNGGRTLIFSQKGALGYQVNGKNCLYLVDARLPKSTYVRKKVFLIQTDYGEVMDLGIYRSALLLNNYVSFEKYEGDYTDEKMNIEFYSISKKRFEPSLSLTSVVVEYLGHNWYNFVSSHLQNENGELIVFFEAEDRVFLKLIVNPETKKYSVDFYWKDEKN